MQHTDVEAAPAAGDQPDPGRTRSRRWLWGVLGATVVLGGAYVGGAYVLSTKVPASAQVGGVDIGGTTPQAAQERIESEVARVESQPVVVTVLDTSFELEPDRAGLRIDSEATLAGITHFTLDPRALYDHLFGSMERGFVLAIDEDALTKAVTAGASEVDKEPVEGTVEFVDGEPTITLPIDGLGVDVPQTAERVAAAWPRSTEIEAASAPVEPVTPVAVFEAFQADFVDKAMSDPLTIAVGEDTFEVPVKKYAPLLSATVADGAITPAIDLKKLDPIVEELGKEAEVLRDARDAKVTFEGTTPSVGKSRTGVAVSLEGQEEPLLAALVAQERTLTLEPVVTEPKFTTERAKATLPKGRISSFTSHYTPAPRAENIKRAARAMNGTYIPPGGTFSLNAVLGERTPAKGYVPAGTIVNNRIVDNYGGGVSQVSTTVYNAAYFAGVQIDEFRPHSFYISRYPEGREATLSWGSIDNKWTNNTDGGILVRSWADNYAITVELWGTKKYDVETVKGPRRNLREPRTIVDDSARCVTQSPQPGFDVTVTRILKQGGREVKRENVTTHYVPQDKVTCTHPNAH